MTLPSDWVDKIFTKLSLLYGRDFYGRWDGQDIGAVKDDWAHELGGFADKPYCIAYALKNMPPDKPPTVLQFRALCNKAPDENVPRLESPRSEPPPEIVARIGAVLAAPVDYKAWAKRLRDIELNNGGWLPNGTKMTRAQREMWRTALESEIEA